VAVNHPSAAVETQVRTAFDQVRAAELLANSATELAQESSNTNLLSSLAENTATEAQALADLQNLLTSLGVKL
jgi:hypothetical protein